MENGYMDLTEDGMPVRKDDGTWLVNVRYEDWNASIADRPRFSANVFGKVVCKSRRLWFKPLPASQHTATGFFRAGPARRAPQESYNSCGLKTPDARCISRWVTPPPTNPPHTECLRTLAQIGDQRTAMFPVTFALHITLLREHNICCDTTAPSLGYEGDEARVLAALKIKTRGSRCYRWEPESHFTSTVVIPTAGWRIGGRGLMNGHPPQNKIIHTYIYIYIYSFQN